MDNFHAENAEVMVWSDVDFSRKCFSSLSTIVEPLELMEENFKQPQSGEGSVLIETVSYIKSLLMSKAQEFQQWIHSFHIGKYSRLI